MIDVSTSPAWWPAASGPTPTRAASACRRAVSASRSVAAVTRMAGTAPASAGSASRSVAKFPPCAEKTSASAKP